MARVFPKLSHSGSRSTKHKFQITDYVPWQRSKQKIKPSTLPPVLQTSGQKKNQMKTLTSIQPVTVVCRIFLSISIPYIKAQSRAQELIDRWYSKSTTLMTSQLRSSRELHRRKLESGKTQARIRLMRMMLRNRQTSLQELLNHENFLTKLNRELIKTIQDMEASSAQKVRETLQQQDTLGNAIRMLEYANRREVQQMKCELQEWEEKQESNLSHLERQLEQLNAKIRKMHEEVNFLSTYVDHKYPVRSVQIANLVHQLQQLKASQQDELDDLKEMHKMILESLSNQIQMRKEKLLSTLVEKTLRPHQEAVLQKTRENQSMVKYRDMFRDFINQFEEEIPTLKAEVEQLRMQTREPREVAFADVLLRRPKCTPDMDVVLSIPVEELLPF